ncbi:MAG: XRE family transcriptional regulator [Sedimentisphaeraceae bacterium JB056]
MDKQNKKTPTGSSFDEFLREENIYEKTTLLAAKKILAMQIAEEMKQQHISKTQMARKMNTSRSSLERLLDPECGSITLQTLDKAAHSLGRRIAISLV